MHAAKIALILLISASLADSASYPPLTPAWSVNLGGDIMDARDIDGDGRLEVTIGLFRDQSYAYLLDDEGVLEWRNKISVIWPQNTPLAMSVDDLEGDNVTDIVVGSVVEAKACYGQLSPYENPLFVLERNPEVENNMLKWVHRGYGYTITLQVADIDGDGRKEIITGTREGSIYAVSADGTLRWKYETPGSMNSVDVRDLNGDGIPEIMGGSFDSVHLLNNLGVKAWARKAGSQILGVHAADINGDGIGEIIASGDNSTLYAYSATGVELWNRTISALKPAIAAGDLEGTGKNDIFVASASTIYAIDGGGGRKWEFDAGYPIISLKAATIGERDDLIVLGARETVNYRINPDYQRNGLAENSLNSSRESYANGSYEKSRDHAVLAMELYAQLNDTEGARQAARMNETASLRLEADRLLAEAQEKYTSQDYAASKEKAVAAERIYLLLGETGHTNQALKLANRAIDQTDASYFLARAIEYYRGGNYLEGTIYSKKTVEIYRLLNDTQNVERASLLLNRTEEYPKANKNYDEALKQYELGNYTAAKTRAELAQNSYGLVGDAGRVATLQTLIGNAEGKISQQEARDSADENYMNASAKFNATSYHLCVEDAEKSRALYQNLSESAGAARAQALKAKCERGIEAQKNFARANEYYANNDYEAATDYAAKARQLYRSIDDVDGALESTNLIEDISQEQSGRPAEKPQDTTAQLIIIASAAVLVIAAAVIFFLLQRSRRRKAKPPRMDYTSLLPPQPAGEAKPPEASPTTLPADILLTIQQPTAPPAPEPPPEPQKTPPELEAEKALSEKLDEILKKAAAAGGPPQPKPPAPRIESRLDQLLASPPQAAAPPSNPAPPKPPEPPQQETKEPGPIEELKIAEKIKKELTDINKKMTR
jgi:hypothetical protein